MSTILLYCLEYLKRHLVSFFLILIVLITTAYLNMAIKELNEDSEDLAKREAVVMQLKSRLQLVAEQVAKSPEFISRGERKLKIFVQRIKSQANVLDKAESRMQYLRENSPVNIHNPLSDAGQEYIALETSTELLGKSINRVKAVQGEFSREFLNSKIYREFQQSKQELKDLRQDLKEKDLELEKFSEEMEQKTSHLILAEFKRHGMTALYILLGVIFLPILFKFLLYYIVAPMASNRAPVQICTKLKSVVPKGTSGTSLSISLQEGQELLLNPDYLQSSHSSYAYRTQWFLNSKIPFTCIIASLFKMTRVRGQSSKAITVSSTKEDLTELACVSVPESAAMVCHPRSLVGVVQNQNKPMRITRHWRLFHLHSYLTLQFRYLVFHGECDLIFKGCRGVIVEKAGEGSLISQSATLAFSADVLYSTKRSETFWAYFFAHDDLFNDCFDGEPCYFVYEQVASGEGAGGLKGKGMQGVFDAMLKGFGL